MQVGATGNRTGESFDDHCNSIPSNLFKKKI